MGVRGVLAGILLAGHLAGSTPPSIPPGGPSAACLRAAATAERRWALPAHLLRAIGEVESGRLDPATGQRLPWPWSINVAGTGYAFRGRRRGQHGGRAVPRARRGLDRCRVLSGEPALPPGGLRQRGAGLRSGRQRRLRGPFPARPVRTHAAVGRPRSANTTPPIPRWAATIARACCGPGGTWMPGASWPRRRTRTSSWRRRPGRRSRSTRRERCPPSLRAALGLPALKHAAR